MNAFFSVSMCLSLLFLSACASKADKPDVTQVVSADNQISHSYCYKYLYGNYGVPADYARAFTWCNKGANAGVANSQTLLAEMYFTGRYVRHNPDSALRWYREAAEQGHGHAQFMLYYFYARGIGTSPEIETAYYWLQKSARNGNLNARTELRENPKPTNNQES